MYTNGCPLRQEHTHLLLLAHPGLWPGLKYKRQQGSSFVGAGETSVLLAWLDLYVCQ